MRALAKFAMQGRSQAIMLASGFAILSLMLPPLSVVSSAVVGLVTLRKGVSAGFIVLALSTVACGLLSLLALGGIGPTIGIGLLLWVPVWLIATLLHYSRSLALALQGGLALGMVIIIGQYLQVQDPVAEWSKVLGIFTQSLVEQQLMDASQQSVLVAAMAKWMPGMLAAGFFLQSMASLFLARWWQAALYNPGGFRSEFHELRLSRALTIVTLIALSVMMVLGEEGALFLLYVMTVLIVGWSLQGLSLVHGIAGKLKANSGWLVGLYLLLVFAMIHTLVVLAIAGMADAWFDFRARLQPKNGATG